MIDAGELTSMQRMVRARVAAGLCARCGQPNKRAPRQACAGCQARQSANGARFRAKHPGYMAAYGKAHRAGLPNPSAVGRADPVDAARDPQGASKP